MMLNVGLSFLPLNIYREAASGCARTQLQACKGSLLLAVSCPARQSVRMPKAAAGLAYGYKGSEEKA